MDYLVPWCIGVLSAIPVVWLLTTLATPVRYLDVEDSLFWLSELVERCFESVTTSITFSLPIVAAVGITYGFYHLGLTVMDWYASWGF